MSGLRTVAFFGSDNLLPAQKRVLRQSGGSEGMLSAVIFKPHQSVVYVQRILIRPLKGPGGSRGSDLPDLDRGQSAAAGLV
jgi:hypothetical protein